MSYRVFENVCPSAKGSPLIILNGLRMFAVISPDLVRMDLDMKAVEITYFMFIIFYFVMAPCV